MNLEENDAISVREVSCMVIGGRPIWPKSIYAILWAKSPKRKLLSLSFIIPFWTAEPLTARKKRKKAETHVSCPWFYKKTSSQSSVDVIEHCWIANSWIAQITNTALEWKLNLLWTRNSWVRTYCCVALFPPHIYKAVLCNVQYILFGTNLVCKYWSASIFLNLALNIHESSDGLYSTVAEIYINEAG